MYSTLLKYPSLHDFVSLWSALKIITNILNKPNPFKSYQLYISAMFLYVVPICKNLVTTFYIFKENLNLSVFILHTCTMKFVSLKIHEWRFHYL